MGNGPLRKTRAVTERRRPQGRQSTPSIILDGAVAGPSTDAPAVTEGRQRQGRQFTCALAVTDGSQKQGRQSTPTSTLDDAVAGPSTDAQAMTEGSQKQGRQSTDALAVTEGSQKQGRESIPMSTLDSAVSGPSTDAQAVIEVSQQQGRQSTPTSTLDGAVAGSFTDALAVTEGRKQQGRQSTSTTTHNDIGCSASQYDLSNSYNTSVGNHGHRGCASQESLGIRIKQLNEVFEETHTLHKAEELLKRHKHVGIIGAPGEGKTSTALNICEKYLHKKYEVVFVDNIEVFDVDTIIQRTCDMLVVFDDIFGSVTVPSNLEKIHKVLTALVDALVYTSFQQEQAAQKKGDGKKSHTVNNKQEETQAGEMQNKVHKLHFIFTSRSYNWNEGRGKMHQFKVSLFKPESVVDMTKTGLTIEEKESILNSFKKRSQTCDISIHDKNIITHVQDSLFGFPLICKLYCTNPAFQMYNIIDFFKNPVTYLRGDLDTIVREGSSRSATLVLLVLCGGKLNLVSFKEKEKNITDLFLALKEEVAFCTQTDIGKEIRNFTDTYCTVENHVAFFSHPSIYDAVACALGNLNEVFLLEHCSLQFLYERVRLNKDDHQQTTYTDDVTNMIYITSSLHPLVISRLVEGVREGCFRWTVGHPVFSSAQLVSDFLRQMMADLPDVVHRKDKSSGECFLYWVSLSTNHSLFECSVSLMSREGSLSHSVLTNFYDSIIGCTQHGNLRHLQHIAARLKQHRKYDVDRRTRGEKTLLMIAAEAGQLGVFNFLLQEGADVSATDKDRYTCLHLSCKSGSKDIVNVIIEKFQHLINDHDGKGNTPAMVCAESGQVEILKFLVSHKADLTLRNVFSVNTFQIACINGHVSVVEYLLTCEHITIDMRGGWGNKTAVMMAAEGGQCDVYNLLVLEGADLSLTDEYNRNCLMLASEGGNVSIVKHLLSLKTFDINRRGGSRKQTAVMMAAERGHYDVYNLLVLKEADLSLTDEYNRNCLMLACEGGNVSIVKHLLFLKTFDINRRGGLSKQTAVLMAAERGHYDVYNLLVLEGADLSISGCNNMDCLMLACDGGHVSIGKHLLSLKIFDINRRGGLVKQTAVMMAAETGQYDFYNLLVLEGADLSLTDRYQSDCLMLACEGGNVSIVKHLLSLKTFDINRRGGRSKQTAVLMAAERGHSDVYNLLVLEGADLSLTNKNDMDCLMLACGGGYLSLVKHLLSLKTFDINRRGGSRKETAVMMAAERGDYGVYDLLVLEGADLSLTDRYQSDCLMLACEGGNVSIVKHLLSLKTFDINRRGGRSKQTAVLMAAERGHSDVYNLLVLEGADLSLTDRYNRDCLMLACEGGDVSIVKHLLFLKTCDINRRGVLEKQTAVMMAAERRLSDVYNILVLEGADLSLTDRYNRDCLMLACEGGDVSIVKHLLSLKTFDINRRGVLEKQTAVMMAAERGHYDVYNLLVLEGADLSLTDRKNRDCLMLACEGGNVSIVKHLLTLNTFDINRRRALWKQTAAMMAAEKGHCEMFDLVLGGADLSLTDEDNSDCLMLACKRGNASTVKHLLSLKTFDINRRGRWSKQTAVMMAAQRGHYDVYDLLVVEGADLSLTDKDNRDCLMLACEGGNVSIVKHLLSLKTFDINRRGGLQKQTAVMMAAEKRHTDVYNLLVLEGADLSLTDEGNNECGHVREAACP
ncbi:serine/threonine-protein phosphatase 6 regulatory ankyrin repeat subunit B-like [Haliotis cracherodii]|uniref:serine/threonine-protein phosphatase 6 regulatory ankyrin repeat subunit B-like n=1 Tax=Haliotis cracherodii TaxID=6455 RepID=UPI0039E9BBC1